MRSLTLPASRTARSGAHPGPIAWLTPGACLWAILWVLSGSPAAVAHEQKESVTRILFNERTGNLEVMHRFYLHDAEHAARQLLAGDADLLASPAARAEFGRYVHQRFSLLDQDERELPLTSVGEELEGRYLWVYAETAIPEGLSGLTIVHDALRDLWPEQVNLVNVDRRGETASALFSGGTRSLEVPLSP